MRDDFSSSSKDTLAKRVGFRCSNPDCRKATSGPQEDPTAAINIGVAAHIHAAAPGGKRYNVTQSSSARSSIENAIWLCQNCAKLIDNDEFRYSTELLQQWKATSENAAMREIEHRFPDHVQGHPPNHNGYSFGEKDRMAMQAQQLRAFYRPKLSIYNKAIQTDSITIITLRNQGYFANHLSIVFPLVDRKIEKMITNKNQLDTDEVLHITLVGNLLRPPVPIQVHVSFIDITGRIYQQDYYKNLNQETLTEPQLLDNINKGIIGAA